MTRVPAGLRRRVLEAVEPTAALTRAARASARRLAQRLRALGRARGIVIEPRLVGSLAKDTHLREPLDIDLFLLLPPATPRGDLEAHGIALGRAVLEAPVLKYAEHPYVHGRADGFEVDVVPAYKLRTPVGRLTAVDRTPFHTEYVRRHATASLRREIRLFKRFLRGVHCYGAETATGGVSGYLSELLVLKYGSFARTVEAVAGWKPPVELALEGPAAPMGGPLVFLDPVDASRNAAAAVQPATFDRLVRAGRAFGRAPRWQFFFPRPPPAAPRPELARWLRRRPTLGVLGPAATGKPGTELPQANRLLAKVRRVLEDAGFDVRRAEAHGLGPTRVLLLVEHAPRQLASTRHHVGPPSAEPDHADRFRAKWAHHPDAIGPPRIRRGRWVVKIRRRLRTPADLVGPQLPHLLDGFSFTAKRKASARLVGGAALLEEESFRVPLTLFLKRLDPWNY